MDLSEENFKAHQSKIEELRLKIDQLETSQFLIESERMKKTLIVNHSTSHSLDSIDPILDVLDCMSTCH